MWHYRAKVLKIVDGDTLDVELDLGFGIYKRERLRLAGIDAYEMRGEEREQGIAAKMFVESIVPVGTMVEVRTFRDVKGKYGRYIATVGVNTSDGITFDLGELLVQEGYASKYGKD